LARVRNPNPAMPDAQNTPYSTKEYADYMTEGKDPFKEELHREEPAHGASAEGRNGAVEAKRGEH
jgi:hypothetical protein